jgi:hypothetical protein
MNSGYVIDLIHIGWMSIEMDSYNPLGSCRDSVFQAGRIKTPCIRIDVHKYRHRPHIPDCVGSRYVGQRRNQNFVSGAHIQRQQRKVQRNGPIADRQTMFDLAKRRKLTFEAIQKSAAGRDPRAI